jgi:uncharacterized membrane protein YbhN (UPF0104 family)
VEKSGQLFRDTLRILGGLLGVAGVVFVVLQLREHADQIAIVNRGAVFWVTIGLLALIYGAANTLLARAWWLVLIAQGADVSWAPSLRTYGISQLAKYLPGNIFHLAGRQALGQAAGLPGKVVARSIVYELILIGLAGTLFLVLVAPLLTPGLSPAWGLAIYFFFFVVVVFGMQQRLGKFVARGFIFQSLFLAVSGLVFLVTVALVDLASLQAEYVSLICGAFIAAWLIGFVTPGAPAGLGVRELVLLVLLDNILTVGGMLTAVLLSRIVSMAGDIVFFTAVAGIKNKNSLS